MGRGIAHATHQTPQPFHHPCESIAQGVLVRSRLHYNVQISTRNGFGNSCHLFQVGNHLGKCARQFADFIFPVDVDVVFQIAGVPNPPRDFHQVGQRGSDRFGAAVGNHDAQTNRQESAKQCYENRCRTRSLIGFATRFYQLSVFNVCRVKSFRGIFHP